MSMPEESLADFISGEQPAESAQQETPPGAPDGAAPANPSADTQALWADSFYFNPKAPLEEFDTSFAAAYAGTHALAPSGEAVVLVGTGKMPFRLDYAASMRSADQSQMLQILDFGAVHEPKTGRPAPAVCYLRPKGNHLVEFTEIPFPPLREDQIIHDVIAPITAALGELKRRRVFHGRINPANLIRREGPQGPVVIGECIAGPPGFDQPLAFETIERCMADPAGKGPGTSADDLYALGVSIAVLCLGVDPMAQTTPDMIVDQKLDKGSYSALVGQRRIPSKLLEPVRGLLTDDAEARWGIEDLELWLSGRRLSPKQATTPQRAGRPLRIGGKPYLTVRGLAQGMTRDVPGATGLIQDGQLNNWIRRTIGDEQLADDVEHAATGSNSRAFREERRIARVAMVLDKFSPIRYRNRSLLPEGIGWAMVDALQNDKPVNEVVDFIESGLVVAWYQNRIETGGDASGKTKVFDRQRAILADPILGFGIERCLYDMNPDLPCQSPLLDDHYVLDLPGLATALDQIAGRAERPPEPLDRHIAAFILSRNPRLPVTAFRQLSEPGDPSSRGMALLTLLAELQVETGAAGMPNLASWMVSQLEPLLDEFRSQRLRDTLKEKLLACAARGNLTDMLRATRNPKVLAGDKAAFRAAQREYWANSDLANRKSKELEKCRDIAESLGHQYSAVVSGLLAVVALATVVLQRLT